MKYFLLSAIIFLNFSGSAKAQLHGEINCDIILKAQFKKSKIKICNKTLDIEIAENDMQRAIGLMCRDSLPENSGMLFIFADERPLSFWMKNTKIPLSIGYLDKNKTLVDIHDLQPMNGKSIDSKKPSMYALETNQGWFTKNKIKPGCKFDFSVTKGQ